jgi:hypothetical protein
MKLANWNTERNCPYGVLNAQDLPALIERIKKLGINKSYEDRKRQIREHLVHAIEIASDTSNFIEQVRDNVDNKLIPEDSVLENGVDWGSMVTGMVGAAMDDFICDESYRYEFVHSDGDGPNCTVFLVKKVSWQLTVIDSDCLTYAHRHPTLGVLPNLCGNLDAPGQFEEDEHGARPLTGWPCLALPPWVWEEFNKVCPYYVRRIDKEGNAEGDGWVNK